MRRGGEGLRTQQTASHFGGGRAGLERSSGARAGSREESVPSPRGSCVSSGSCPEDSGTSGGPCPRMRGVRPRSGCSAASSPLSAGGSAFPSSSTFTDSSSQGKAVTAPLWSGLGVRGWHTVCSASAGGFSSCLLFKPLPPAFVALPQQHLLWLPLPCCRVHQEVTWREPWGPAWLS